MKSKPSPGQTEVLGVRFDRVTIDQALERVGQAIAERRFFHVVTPGPEFVMLARQNDRYRQLLRNADLSLTDGAGIVLAAKILGRPALRRITGNDLVDGVFRQSEQRGWRIACYGIRHPATASRIAESIRRQYPRVQLVMVESGWRHWRRLSDSLVGWKIRRSRADVVLVALGAPEQEFWIDRNHRRFGSTTVAIGIGGALDYFAGTIPRAPKFLRAVGLEWLIRLIIQPRRRWRRMVTAVIEFPAAVIREMVHA